MSLLLDARKKQLAQGGHGKYAGFELSLEEQPNPAAAAPDMQQIRNIRSAGQNLFSVKSPNPSASHTDINRNLLLTLCGTILLLAAGAGYYWHDNPMSGAQLPHPDMSAPLPRPVSSAAPAEPKARNTFVTETATTDSTGSTTKPLLAITAPPVKNKALPALAPRENSTIRIERGETGLVDPLLDNAYLAYRDGNLGVAQQLYREMLDRDARNTDALLGLAVIARQRGEDTLASQYYSRALALDPRNAVANAGMSALAADGSSESRLKILLDEQKDSAILHFALGNRYAEQSRWGEAQQTYFNAYTLEPGNAEFAFNLAVSLDHLGQNKLAAQYYQRALQLDKTGGDPEPGPKFDHAQTEQRVRELTR
ncbi:MAG: tetratricopeptide repeat protein [Nitrosomonadales bacterium]|nr:tetratricopeptide repeat protein [Nitrosomonadales bacterium]